jgi:NodT family efflux transporter outer membrane factor (OMF) lipoprotein
MQERVRAGLNPPVDAGQAASAEQVARAALAEVDEEIARDRNRIAALVGAGPDRGLSLVRPPIAMAQGFGAPQDLALGLLGRRPDIVSARLRAEAAASRIRQARADFYPNINLAAVIGLQSFGLANLIEHRSIYGNVGPAISLPLFNQGSVGGRYAEARARYDEAVGNYNQALITALREVADALAGKKALLDRLTAERAALAQAESVYSAARKRFEAGLSSRLELLSAEEALLPRRQAVADLEARAFSLDIDLIRALGGGFNNNGQSS